MRNRLTRAARLTARGVVVAALASGAAQGQVKDQPLRVSASQLNAMVAKTTDGFTAALVPMGPGAYMAIVRRDRTGEVEVHMKLNDEYVVRSGRARELVGEKVEGGREVRPGEWHGGTIIGGKTYDLAPGDVFWIPAGMGHQSIVPKGTTFEYLVAKFPVVKP